MEHSSFKTIKKPSQGLFKERGSKFLSFAYPVNNEEEIKEILGTLRGQYHDARHHCYAWRLGDLMEQDFGNECRLRVRVPAGHRERFAGRMELIYSVNIKKLLIIF